MKLTTGLHTRLKWAGTTLTINKKYLNGIIWVFVLAQAVLIPLFLGVDVPYRDEWDSIIRALVLRQNDGFHINQLFLPVVEHRLPLPMSIFELLSRPRYYPKLLMTLTALVHVVGWFFFLRSANIGKETSFSSNPNIALAILPAILFFHFAQIINYTMGVQLFWVLGPVGTHIFIYGLTKERLSVALIGHIVAILSFPAWPIHAFILLGCLAWFVLKKEQSPKLLKQLSLIFVVTGIVTLGFLYRSSGPGFGLQPFRLAKFALFVLASPLSRYDEVAAWVFGPMFLVLWCYGLLKGPVNVSPRIFFLYGLLGVGSSLLIAYGRHLYDFSYAFSGHYLLFTAPGWCLVLYESLVIRQLKSLSKVLSTLFVLYLLIIGGRDIYKEITKRRTSLLFARECIVQGRERSTECRAAMEDIFLNNFEDKYSLLERARDLGVFP